ncbi:MAG: hypothetical protein WAO35_18735 [Terriglobia bacterium]
MAAGDGDTRSVGPHQDAGRATPTLNPFDIPASADVNCGQITAAFALRPPTVLGHASGVARAVAEGGILRPHTARGAASRVGCYAGAAGSRRAAEELSPQ